MWCKAARYWSRCDPPASEVLGNRPAEENDRPRMCAPEPQDLDAHRLLAARHLRLQAAGGRKTPARLAPADHRRPRVHPYLRQFHARPDRFGSGNRRRRLGRLPDRGNPLMYFTSDNASGAAPEIMAALARANDGYARSYGADAIMDRLHDQIRATFQAPEAAVAAG